MNRIAIIFIALILVSGCAKSSVHTKIAAARSSIIYKSSLIEKGTFNWHRDRLPPPLKEIRSFKVGKLRLVHKVSYYKEK